MKARTVAPELAAALKRLRLGGILPTLPERIALADTAIARARSLFNKADMCAKTLAVYDEVLARPSA